MKNLKPKISIIGAGNVGSAFAFSLMTRGLAREIAIIDSNESKAKGECMDLNHGLSFAPPVKIYSAGFEACENSDLVVITAGAKQKPNQTRIDLVQTNAEIFKEIIPQIVQFSKEAVLLIVSNPVDILTSIALKISGLPPNKVIGSGTVLDSSRLRYLISEHCLVDPRNVHAYIIGEHGDTELPVWSNANIGGMKIQEYCPTCKNFEYCKGKIALEKVFENVRNAAYEIIRSKGASYYAIALSLVKITEAILRDENSVLPVSSLIHNYYGVNDVCLSVPAIVNKSGVSHILKINLSDEEREKFIHSASTLKSILEQIKW